MMNSGNNSRKRTDLHKLATEDPDTARREVLKVLLDNVGQGGPSAHALEVSPTQLHRVLRMLGIGQELSNINREMRTRYRVPGGIRKSR